MANELRELVEQVQKSGGPLTFYETYTGNWAIGHETDSEEHPAAWLLDDLGSVAMAAIADVLCSDLVARRCDVVAVHTPTGYAVDVFNVGRDEPAFATGRGDSALVAMLKAWISAARGQR